MTHAVFSLQALYDAYLSCRKNKRNSRAALEFEMNAEENLQHLLFQLRAGTYRPLPSLCFVTHTPKSREIFAARFEDRIVHHLVVRHLEKTWEPRFIHDSFACRKGKGTHAAVARLGTFMRKVGRNGYDRAYFIHIDIRSFFVSINKKILFKLLSRKEKHPEIRCLLNVIVFNDPAIRPVIRSTKLQMDSVPSHKSLFSALPDV